MPTYRHYCPRCDHEFYDGARRSACTDCNKVQGVRTVEVNDIDLYVEDEQDEEPAPRRNAYVVPARAEVDEWDDNYGYTPYPLSTKEPTRQEAYDYIVEHGTVSIESIDCYASNRSGVSGHVVAVEVFIPAVKKAKKSRASVKSKTPAPPVPVRPRLQKMLDQHRNKIQSKEK